MTRLFSASLLLVLSACSLMPVQDPPIPPTAQPLSWAEVMARPAPTDGVTLPYGTDPLQFGVLRLPGGPGPHPVVALLHGGCWLNAYDFSYFSHWAQWLTTQGFATWNIEYRRLGDAGGGWPGTFQDVGQALDTLRELAGPHRLDLRTLRVAGHSAGGHLALWAASRAQLPGDSELSRGSPVPVHQVIGLAAITNLENYRVGPADSCHASVDALLDGDPQTRPERYALASPAQRLPLGTRMVLIQGERDRIVSPQSCQAFVEQAQASGDRARCLLLPGAGHFDTGVPTAASKAAMQQALQD